MTKKELVEQLSETYAALLNKKGMAEFDVEYDPNEAIKEIAYMTIKKTEEGLKEMEDIAEKYNVLTMMKELGDHYYRTNY